MTRRSIVSLAGSRVPWPAVVAVVVVGLMSMAGTAKAADDAWSSPPAKANGKIVLRVASAQAEEQPFKAGKAAAESLEKMMGGQPLRAVIVSECFEDKEFKRKLLGGICSVLPETIVLGGATYGSFSQAGCADLDAVCLLGIGGEGISVSAGLVTEMGASKLTFDKNRAVIEKRLRAAGEKLAAKLRKTDRDRLLILIPDAHSPKNQAVVEGVQKVMGKKFPITGGSVNKNAGQTFVYYRGRMYEDAAIALLLSGEFNVSMSGRQAKEEKKVIATANQGAAQALAKFKGKPIAALAFNCAGRRSKLGKMTDELAAIQKAMGKDLPLFGCYCAGEIGPLDTTDKKPDTLSGGSGWHVMFTIIGK